MVTKPIHHNKGVIPHRRVQTGTKALLKCWNDGGRPNRCLTRLIRNLPTTYCSFKNSDKSSVTENKWVFSRCLLQSCRLHNSTFITVSLLATSMIMTYCTYCTGSNPRKLISDRRRWIRSIKMLSLLPLPFAPGSTQQCSLACKFFQLWCQLCYQPWLCLVPFPHQ